MNKRKIIVLGSIAYDFIMNYSGDMNQTITMDPVKKIFNLAVMPETKIKAFGGTAGNIGYNLSLLGTPAALVTSVGRDFIELGYSDRIKAFPNVEFEGKIHTDSHSASCYIVNDNNKNQLIIFHRGAMIRGKEISLKEKYPHPEQIKIASISPDYSPAMIQWAQEFYEMKVPFLFDPGQVTPEFTTEALREIIPKAFLLIGNEYEISIILKKLDCTFHQLLKLNPNIIITKGSLGSECHFQDHVYEIPICSPKKLEDPTGAGDGYRAGLLYGLYYDLPFEIACKIGSVVGSLVVESIGPQSQQYNVQTVKTRFEENFHEKLPI